MQTQVFNLFWAQTCNITGTWEAWQRVADEEENLIETRFWRALDVKELGFSLKEDKCQPDQCNDPTGN